MLVSDRECLLSYPKASIMLKLITALTCLLLSLQLAAQDADVVEWVESVGSHPDTIQVIKLDSMITVYRAEDVPTTRYLIGEGYEVAQGVSDINFLGRIHNANAIAFFFQSKLDSAHHYFAMSIAIYDKVENQQMLARLHNNRALVYNAEGRYKEAIESSIASLKAKEILGDEKGVANTQFNIASTWIEIGDYEKAESYLTKANVIYEKLGDESSIVDVKWSMASIAGNRKNYRKAVGLEREVLQYYSDLEDGYAVMDLQSNLGQNYTRLEIYDSSLYFLNSALRYAEDLGAKDNIASIYRSIGDIYSQKGENQKAIRYISTSVELFDSLGYRDELSDSYQFLYEAQEKSGLFEAAYDNLHNYMIIKDSIASKKMQTDLAELETKYETEKKEAQIILLEKEAELDEIRRKALWSGIGLLALLGGGVSYGQYQKRKREQEVAQKEKEVAKKEKEVEIHKRQVVEQELDFKKKELTAKALQLASKNEFLSSLEEEVSRLSSSIDGSITTATCRISRMIKSDSDDEDEWSQFSKEFTSVHQDFVDRLVEKYGSFTSGEMRLVSLLKMNLSSKEIANILRVSDEGIKKSRYRLRKKMNLNSEDDLAAIVLSI